MRTSQRKSLLAGATLALALCLGSATTVQAVSVTVTLKDSHGGGISGGTVKWNDGSWHEVSSTVGGTLTFDISNLTYNSVVVTYHQTTQTKTRAEVASAGNNPVFQTIDAGIRLIDSQGNGLAGGLAAQGQAAWADIGLTGIDGRVAWEVFPGTYQYRMNYNHGSQQGLYPVPGVVFQTSKLLVVQVGTPKLVTSNAGGSWWTVPSPTELLPGNYALYFSGVYNTTATIVAGQTTTVGSAPKIAATADAGPDQGIVGDPGVFEGQTVTLNGTGSHDNNTPALPLTYAWTQSSGLSVTLANATTASPTFTAPSVNTAGAVLVFTVAVSNGGTPPATDTVTVNVTNLNSPPTANPGLPQTVDENTLVTFSGVLSSDPDDGSTLTLHWTQVGGPTVILSGADAVSPSFTAPDVTAVPGVVDLTFQLIVNDGYLDSAPEKVVVHVINVNDAPIANAGPSQTVSELDLVKLDGTGSSDPDNNALTYSWIQTSGTPTVSLRDANAETPSFTAPVLNVGGVSYNTTLTFELSVSDANLSSKSTVNVNVVNVNTVPLADAGDDQTVPENTLVTLNGDDSADTDGDALTYAWLQTSGPDVTLVEASTAKPSFTTPATGSEGAVLSFQLTVADSYGGVASDEVVVNVTYVNQVPTASAGTPQTVNEGDTAILAGTASDPDGNDLTIGWTQVSGPTVTVDDAGTLTPRFAAPKVTLDEDDVVLRLTVDDGYLVTASSDVTIHIANINCSPTAQAPGNLSVSEGSPVNLIGQGQDPDAEEQSQLTYAWQQTAPVVGPSYAGSTFGFTAPLVTGGGDPNAKETLTFVLTVTDPNGAKNSSAVDVVVANIDHGPTALVGGNLAVDEAASLTLNGSASSDPDGDSLTYAWEQTSGPEVTLNDANTAFPNFIAPFVNAAGATLQFTLTVTDPYAGTSSATMSVTVKNINDPPNVANARASLCRICDGRRHGHHDKCDKKCDGKRHHHEHCEHQKDGDVALAVLWSPDHCMVQMSIVGVIDPENNATIRITGVTQDEATNGLGGGDTGPDAVINADGSLALLRAERADKGDGRVYHVHFTATDFEDSVSGVVNVYVPRNKKGDRVSDGGELFDSTKVNPGAHDKDDRPKK